MLYNGPGVFYGCNTRLHVTAIDHTTFHQEGASQRFNGDYCLQVRLHRLFIDQWTHMIRFIQWITNSQLLISMCELLGEFIVDAFVNDQPAGSCATLPCRSCCTKYATSEGNIKVCIFRDDDSIVPA